MQDCLFCHYYGNYIILKKQIQEKRDVLCEKPMAMNVEEAMATFKKLGNRNELDDKKGYQSSGAKKEDVSNVEDLVSALIRFDNGFVLDVEASFSLNTKKNVGKIELFGDKGGAKIEDELELYTVMNNRMVNVNFDSKITWGDFFGKEINHYVDCIINGTPCIAPAKDGIEMMKILTAIYESAKTGHEVIL